MKEKLAALCECVLVFLAAACVMRVTFALPAMTAWSAGRNFAGYGAVGLLAVLVLVLKRRPWKQFGLVKENLSHQWEVFLAAFFPFLLTSFALSKLNWHTWGGAMAVAGVTLTMIGLTAWLMRKKPPFEVVGSPPAGLLLAVPLAAGASSVLPDFIYFYIFVAWAEEVLFRGFIQSSLNLAWGRPLRFFGIPWGMGLLLSSLLFALWHVLPNPLDIVLYPQALWTFCAGLLFGLLREKSGGVGAGALLHGVLNYSPVAIILALAAG